MAAPGFWDDSRRAQGVVQERAALARVLETFRDLSRHAEEAKLYCDMAIEAADESLSAEIEETVERVLGELEAFELKVTLSGPQDAKNAIVSISDTGKGIKPEHLNKIFDPGFTTKGVGVGTGLGLSISFRIVQDQHGTISVESDVAKGTTFTLRLPIEGAA